MVVNERKNILQQIKTWSKYIVTPLLSYIIQSMSAFLVFPTHKQINLLQPIYKPICIRTIVFFLNYKKIKLKITCHNLSRIIIRTKKEDKNASDYSSIFCDKRKLAAKFSFFSQAKYACITRCSGKPNAFNLSIASLSWGVNWIVPCVISGTGPGAAVGAAVTQKHPMKPIKLTGFKQEYVWLLQPL